MKIPLENCMEKVEVLEFQADLQNIQNMSADYDEKNKELVFDRYSVFGAEQKRTYFIVEKVKENGKTIHKIVGKVDKAVVFDKTPRYRMDL